MQIQFSMTWFYTPHGKCNCHTQLMFTLKGNKDLRIFSIKTWRLDSLDIIFSTGCIRSHQNHNFKYSQWQKFCLNDNSSCSVRLCYLNIRSWWTVVAVCFIIVCDSLLWHKFKGNFVLLHFNHWPSDHNKCLHMARQHSCRAMCKTL